MITGSMSSRCVCGGRAYQDAADRLRGAGLLAVGGPVQGDLTLAVRDADVGVVLDQQTHVFRPVVERGPVEGGLLLGQGERVRDRGRAEERERV